MLWKNELKVSFLTYANCGDTLQKVLMMKDISEKGERRKRPETFDEGPSIILRNVKGGVHPRHSNLVV